MGKEIKVRKDKRKGIRRKGTLKKDQIKYTAAKERFMVEEWLSGRYWDPIIKGIATNRVKIKAIRIKVTKLLKYYRFEEPSFAKMSDRSSKPFTRRENSQLLIAVNSPYIKETFKNPYKYMSRVFGREEKQLKKQINVLNKKSLFN